MPAKTIKPKAPPKSALPLTGTPTWSALPMAWDGDRLLITEPEGVAKIARKRLSPSTAKSMHSCGARYAAEKLMRGQEDPFAPAPFGTSVHRVLENFYKMPMPARTRAALEEHVRKVLAESAVPHSAESWPGIDRGRHEEWLSLVTANASRIFDIEDPTTVQVRALEMNLDTVSLEGVPFVGFIDRIDITGDGRVFGSGIVDYKSGNQPGAWKIKQNDAQGDQLRTYVAALTELDGVKPLSAKLHYTQTGKTREVPIGPRLVAQTVAGFVKSWDILNGYVADSAFATEVSALCGWCALVNSCPVAARADKVARIDGLPTAVQLGIPTFRSLADLVTVDVDFDPADPDYLPPEPPNWLPIDPGYPDADLATLVEPPADDSDVSAALSALDVEALEVGGVDTKITAVAVAAAQIPVGQAGATPTMAGDDVSGPTHMQDIPVGPVEREENFVTVKKYYEDKPYVESANGELNLASYAAISAFDLTDRAKDALLDAGLPLNKPYLSALAGSYALIIARVQEALTGQTGMQMGTNTRVRYLLTRHLHSNPAPLGGTQVAWEQWMAAAIKRIYAIALVAIDLYDRGLPADDVFGPLVGIEMPSKQLKAV